MDKESERNPCAQVSSNEKKESVNLELPRNGVAR